MFVCDDNVIYSL